MRYFFTFLFLINICVSQDIKFEAFFPDVNGHQSGGILKFPGHRCVLYDAGMNNGGGPNGMAAARYFARDISDFLVSQSRSSRVLDIIVSHPSEDAFGLIEQIITELPRVHLNFTVGNIILGGKGCSIWWLG